MAKILLPDSSPVTPPSVPATVLFDGTRWSKAAVCGALLTATLSQAVHAAPGDLDPSFDADGKVLTDFRPRSRSHETATAVVVQPDGKLVAAGRPRFLLARYHPDGSLDRSFGRGGRVETGFGASSNALALQPDAKLVAAGRAGAGDGTSRSAFALVRYDPNGRLDTSFDGDGLVLTDIATRESASALVLQSDGKLVALGTSVGDFALVRYRPDGSLDTDFNAGGLVVTTFGASEFAGALALQPDGRLVTAGGSNTSGDRDFALARYLSANEQPPLPPTCGGVSATTLGTAGNDVLRGTRLMDVILGSAGNDTIRGLGGNDILCGGPGRDVLTGNDGDDKLFGGAGRDVLRGGDGDDKLFGGPGRDILMGENGGDKLFGGQGKDQLFGGKGRDRLDGNRGNDDCNGGPGRDTIINC